MQNGHRIWIHRAKTMKMDYLLVFFGAQMPKHGFRSTWLLFQLAGSIGGVWQAAAHGGAWLRAEARVTRFMGLGVHRGVGHVAASGWSVRETRSTGARGRRGPGRGHMAAAGLPVHMRSVHARSRQVTGAGGRTAGQVAVPAGRRARVGEPCVGAWLAGANHPHEGRGPCGAAREVDLLFAVWG